jgi:PhzF family phenazine biosynthesis protein
MQIKTYHIDAFTKQVFGGNPAMVCLLEKWLPATSLQAIAAENHLPATAFLVQNQNTFATRWFTPEYEIDLCGHGTLALGYVIFNKLHPSLHEVSLESPAGPLRLSRQGEAIILDLPVKKYEALPASEKQLEALLTQGLGSKPQEIYQFQSERCLAIFQTEEEIKQIQPNLSLLQALPYRGIIITAKGSQSDFVSRVFYPHKRLAEDAVTGSSHCLLVPFWAEKLNKKSLRSRQLSQRSGDLACEWVGERVFLSGHAVLYKEGTIFFPEPAAFQL